MGQDDLNQDVKDAWKTDLEKRIDKIEQLLETFFASVIEAPNYELASIVAAAGVALNTIRGVDEL